MKTTTKLLLAAAIAGAITARPALAQSTTDNGAQPPAADKNGCKAKDGCKAKEGCKAKGGTNAPSDKASCKSKDGCKSKDSCKGKDGAGK